MVEPTESVREIVNALVNTAIARCANDRIALDDFYSAMTEEIKITPAGKLEDLLDKVFLRLKALSN